MSLYPSIHLAQGLEIPTFFLVISLVLSVSLWWITKRCDLYHLPKRKVLDLSLLLMIAGLVGSRLMHVLYENLSYYQEDPVRIFYLWDGGFVFYGGLTLALVAAFFYFRILRPEKVGSYFDAFAPVVSFAYGFGRMGCFLAGCCYGGACDYPWAIAGKHPTQLYALLWEAGVILILLGLEKIPSVQRISFLRRSGDLFVLWMGLHAVGRLLMESLREDFRGDLIFGFSVSTVFSVLLLTASLGVLSRPFSRRVRRS